MKVAFVICRYPFGISSIIVNSIKLFAQKGISVDVYVSKKSFEGCPVDFFDSNIRLFIFNDKGFNILFRGYRYIMKYTSNCFYPILKRLNLRIRLMVSFPEVSRFSAWLKSLTDFERYDYILPVDCHSLLTLYDMAKKEKLVYYDVELLDWKPSNAVYGHKLMLKALEHRLIRFLECAVLPSPVRAHSFCKINTFPLEKIQILPVAAIGNPILIKSRYFRDKFLIPDNQIIILYSGNFVPWFQCIEIIDAIKACRVPYSLIMHTWNQSSTETTYFKHMVRHASNLPVHFSTEYISTDNLTEALSSADIGLAFYDSMDDNCREILFSSNKIGEYLKAGLPIITSNYKHLHDFVHDNKIGLAIPAGDIPDAVEEISSRIDEYRSNVLKCYNSKYRFESYFEGFYRQLYACRQQNGIHAQYE